MKTESTFIHLLRPVLLLATLVAFPLQAQDVIELSADERSRLGILTRPVTAADNSEGVRVPGVVINSPMAATRLVALYGGVVERWLVQSGEAVGAGTPLVEIRSPDLINLQREWKQAQTDLDQARYEAEKDRLLFDEGVIARRRLTDTERRLGNAEFALTSASEALRHAGFDEKGLEVLSGSGSRQGLYLVRAPVPGMLSQRLVKTGETVEAGMTVGSVTGAERLWVEASVPASFVRRLQPGQVLGLGGGDAEVVIRLMDQSIDNLTQTFDIQAEFLSGDEVHLPGEIVGVVLAAAGEGVWVPASAVVHNGLETVIYVETAGGFQPRTLNLVPGGSGYVASEGLGAGERVVVQGTAILKGMELGLGGDE